MPLWAVAFLALTAGISLVASHSWLIAGDDFLELWCDRAGGLGQVLHIQRTAPLAIDPFFYHLVTFLGLHLFGLRPMLLRLPSLVGFLAMQVCLFHFVRRIASERVAVLALALPLITGAFGYTLQIRPYGLLLGLFGVAMLSWQTAVRREERRGGVLVVLAVSVAIAINTHYYGFLFLVPLGVGELVRAWQRRRLDVPMLVALGAGVSGVVGLLPFLKGAAEYREHIEGGGVSVRAILQTYNFILLGQDSFSAQMNHGLAVVMVVLFGGMVWSCVRQWRSQVVGLPDAEFAFVLALAGLPVVTFLLGHFVTHAMEPRYSLGAMMGIAVLLAVAVGPALRSVGEVVLVVVFGWALWMGVGRIEGTVRARREALANTVLPEAIRRAMMESRTGMLYTQDVDLVGFEAFHSKDRTLLSHLVLVYSREEEMRWIHSGSDSRTVMNLGSFTTYKIVPYERVMAEPGEHLFVVTHGGWNWLDKAFASGELQVKPIGQAFGGEVVAVRALGGVK
jgi:hypothetical protein